MTEKDVKEKLENYKRIRRDIQKAVESIREMEAKSLATGSMIPKPDKVKSSLPLSARWEDAVIEKADLERIVEQETARLDKARKEVMKLIDRASSARGRVVLTEYYINGRTNNDIAEGMHYELRSVFRIKRKAIKQIARDLKKMS